MKKILSVQELLNFNLPQGELSLFHQKTKIRSGQVLNTKKYPPAWTRLYYKGYPRFKEIQLPLPKLPQSTTLLSVLQERKSIRNFKKSVISLKKISSLCYYSFGHKVLNDPVKYKRFYPSAGSRYPIEIYIISLTTDLPKGVYHYYCKRNSLEFIRAVDFHSIKEFTIPPAFKKASLLIVMTGMFERNAMKYGVRSYPLTLLEAGHIGQNISLVTSALNLSSCAIGGFGHYTIDELIGIDGFNESSLYMFAVGKKTI